MDMKKLTGIVALLIWAAAGRAETVATGTETGGRVPFDMPEVSAPVFPETRVVLTEFGAVGDGTARGTEPVALASCGAAGNMADGTGSDEKQYRPSS